jgi:hypothetical protein
MQYNKLGDSGLLVSELSFGAWVTFQVRSALALAHAHAASAVGPARWRRLPLPLLADPWRCCLQHEGQVSQVEACLEIMKAAYDGGVNFFDNAEGARCMCQRLTRPHASGRPIGQPPAPPSGSYCLRTAASSLAQIFSTATWLPLTCYTPATRLWLR